MRRALQELKSGISYIEQCAMKSLTCDSKNQSYQFFSLSPTKAQK